MRNALIAMAALACATVGGADVIRGKNGYERYIDDIKYAPRARPKGRAGAKLWKKAREGRLGLATLR